MFTQLRSNLKFLGTILFALVFLVGGFLVTAPLAFANVLDVPTTCTGGTPFLTVTQQIKEADTGLKGIWATDTFTETATVYRSTDSSNTFCAVGLISSGGTFVTTGPNSPEQGTSLAAGITGTITGGETWVFPANTTTNISSSTFTATPVNAPTADSKFSDWQNEVFGTTVGANSYTFNYVTDTDSNITWTNAINGNSGDITNPTLSIVYVDGTNGSDSNIGSQASPFLTIQAAISAVTSGGTINVATGNYDINAGLTIAKNITLKGNGTVVLIADQAPIARSEITTYHGQNPIVWINSANVTIENITVKATNMLDYTLVDGITASGNSVVTLNNVVVTDIMNMGIYNGMQYGRGYTGDTGTKTTIINSTFTNFNKNGVHFYGVGTTGSVDNSSFTGTYKTTGSAAQNGVVFQSGATGSVTNSKFENIWYSLDSDIATGVLSYGAGSIVTVSDNTFTQVQTPTSVAEGGVLTVANSQVAPTEILTGVAPTSLLNDGKITGTTIAMEYKLSTNTTYTLASAIETTGLTTGTYDVRYATKEGYNAGVATTVIVPAYVAPVVHGSSGGYTIPAVTANTTTPDGCAAGAKFSTTTGRNCNAATPAVPAGQVLGASTQVGQVLGAEKFNFTKFLKFKAGSYNVSLQGTEVTELQKFLTTLGYTLTADGKFGPKTNAAVIKFQIANGLKGDGVVGALTRAALNK